MGCVFDYLALCARCAGENGTEIMPEKPATFTGTSISTGRNSNSVRRRLAQASQHTAHLSTLALQLIK
jgi:hypothetical protein